MGAAAARPSRLRGRLPVVSAAALRLARFNIQSAGSSDKRYFVGMPSPAGGSDRGLTVFVYPYGSHDYRAALPALAMVLVPAVLMVSTIRFRSFKTIDLKMRRLTPCFS